MGKQRSEQRSDPALAELRGSRPWTKSEGRRVVDAWKASGASVSAFARKAGLITQRVYWWRHRLGGDDPTTAPLAAPALAFLPVTIAAPFRPSARATVTVCVREGLRVEVAELDATSVAWVAALVRALEEVPS